MATQKGFAKPHRRSVLRNSLSGPQVLAFLPGVTLAAFWLGGELALLGTAVALPALYAALGTFSGRQTHQMPAHRAITDDGLRDRLIATMDGYLEESPSGSRNSVCLVIEVDEFKSIEERFGHKIGQNILSHTAERLAESLREFDQLARITPTTFAISVAPMRRCDLEVAIQIAARLQEAVETPIGVDGLSVYVTANIGFCLSNRSPERSGEALMDAAHVAMIEARRNGPSAIRAYTPEMRARIDARHSLIEEVGAALDSNDIVPWFQPQISTETGKITGFEALARWYHPDRGLVSPAEFLPAVEQAGLMGRLGEKMLFQALTALKSWEAAGVFVPSVGVNFSPDELRNPKLVEKVKWELDRFELTADRLAVEVLESVVATSADDTITLNIGGLADLGCGIDLDDFGTGHASISSIRRFSVSRIKIDRSFVTKVDVDTEQQRMLAAILLMAERLDLETLAEGVESVGEHTILAQLGCGHVQGYGLARPMPFEETLEWIQRHNAKLGKTPQITRRARG